jgi:hypothetical protein
VTPLAPCEGPHRLELQRDAVQLLRVGEGYGPCRLRIQHVSPRRTGCSGGSSARAPSGSERRDPGSERAILPPVRPLAGQWLLLLVLVSACGRIGYDSLPLGADATPPLGRQGDAGARSGDATTHADARTADADSATPRDASLSDARTSIVDASIDASSADASSVDANASLLDASVADASDSGLVDVPPTTCSLTSLTAADFTIINNYSNTSVTPYWIDFNCAEQPYPVVPPRSRSVRHSFLTHPWRIRDTKTHALLVEVPPLTGPTTLTVP